MIPGRQDEEWNPDHQEEGVPLPQRGHGKTFHSKRRRDRHRATDHDLPCEHTDCQPQRQRAIDHRGSRANEEQQAIYDWIKHRAELALLIEATGNVAVHPVRDTEKPKEQRSKRTVVE